jgi:uncharacterized protein
MLAIPLVRLEREGSLEIRAEIPPEDPNWEGTELRFSSPLSVSGRIQTVPSGEVVARLRLQGVLKQECRRCLEPVTVQIDEDVDLVFAPVDEGEEGAEDQIRPLPAGMVDLDLTEPLREEIVLSQSLLVLCKTECRGLCPHCGLNLNEERCQCRTEEEDPRWDTLRALNDKRE